MNAPNDEAAKSSGGARFDLRRYKPEIGLLVALFLVTLLPVSVLTMQLVQLGILAVAMVVWLMIKRSSWYAIPIVAAIIGVTMLPLGRKWTLLLQLGIVAVVYLINRWNRRRRQTPAAQPATTNGGGGN